MEPCASRTARETMFSDAISSISCCWRPSSRLIEAATALSALARLDLKKPLPAALRGAAFFFAALTFFATLRAMVPSVLIRADERHRRNHPRGPEQARHATTGLRQAARFKVSAVHR